MERKGKWWREYTKQHLREGELTGLGEPDDEGPEPDVAPEPIMTSGAGTFRITIAPPRKVQQAQKLTPYQKFKNWVFRHIGKILFAMALYLIRHILKKQSKEQSRR